MLAEPVAAALGEVGDGVFGEEGGGVTRRRVASSATALAPFSQNSAAWRLSGSGQAQPGAVEAVLLVDLEEGERGAAHAHLLVGYAQ
ncbi:hypothetical protein GCM10020000_61410 [Streptomyces olivoverticillatus]